MRNAFSSSAFGASASDATKLPLTGGTLSGNLYLSSISQGFTFTSSAQIIVTSNSQPLASFDGGGAVCVNFGSTGIGFGSSTAYNNVDLRVIRAAAASLQLGANHATTATNQTIKAHNVTTGTGADLCLKGGTGSVANGVVSFGVRSAIGAETITGFITIKDEGGTVRKLAVVS